MSGNGGFDLIRLLQSDLQDEEVRDQLSLELEKVFVNQFNVNIDEFGILHVDMRPYLRDVASSEVETRGLLRAVFGTDNIDTLAIFNVNDSQVRTNYNDQEIAKKMLDEGQSSVSVPLQETLDEAFRWYLNNKDTIDADINNSLSYSYTAIDKFTEGGGKISNLIS